MVMDVMLSSTMAMGIKPLRTSLEYWGLPGQAVDRRQIETKVLRVDLQDHIYILSSFRRSSTQSLNFLK